MVSATSSEDFLVFDQPLQVTVYRMLRDRCLSDLSVTLVYCGQTVGWIKMPLGYRTEVGLGSVVLHVDPAPPRKGAQQSPYFSAHVYCGQTVAHLSNW